MNIGRRDQDWEQKRRIELKRRREEEIDGRESRTEDILERKRRV
jgi:hypothetical protein